MSGWHDFYGFWVHEQTIPGNILGDVLIGAGAYLIGKFKVAPWLHRRHQEQLDQAERHHRELLHSHQQLLDSHRELRDQNDRHHAELLAAGHTAAAAVQAEAGRIETLIADDA